MASNEMQPEVSTVLSNFTRYRTALDQLDIFTSHASIVSRARGVADNTSSTLLFVSGVDVVHDLCTAAVRLHELGCSLEQIASIAGHDTVAIVKICCEESQHSVRKFGA